MGANKAAKSDRTAKETRRATPRDEPCGPADDDSGITNVGGSASGRREPHGCTRLQVFEGRTTKKKPAR